MDLLNEFLHTLPYSGPLIALCCIGLYLPDRFVFRAGVCTWLLAICLELISVKSLTPFKQSGVMAIAFGAGYLVPVALTAVTIVTSRRSSTGRVVQLALSLIFGMSGLVGTVIVDMFILGAVCKVVGYCV